MTALLLATILWGAPLPFPKKGDFVPTGRWPVGRWEIAAEHEAGRFTYFTLQLNPDGSGWVNHRDPNRRKPLRWQRLYGLDGTWIDFKNDPDPTLPEESDIGRDWALWVSGEDGVTGKMAGNPMSMRRLR